MQIRGCEKVISTQFSAEETITHMVNAIRKTWGNLIVETNKPQELFVFKSSKALDSWDLKGWNREYAKDLIVILPSLAYPDKMTVIIEDEKDPELIKILEDITEAIKP